MTRWWTGVFAASLLVACDGGVEPPTDAGGEPVDCTGEVVVGADITADTTWECPTYVLSRRIFVESGATLTIAPGTTILGEVGVAETTALVVTRGARLIARGTEAEPIVFTSGNPEGARITGDWAGVVLLGDAPTNDGACEGDGDTATEACDAPGYLQDRVEGIDVGDDRGLYGGTSLTGSCGELEYVRIEFAGAELSPDNELNGLTLGACGSGTLVSHVQVHRGKDDGVELFGGTVSLDHVVISGASDDGLDFDEGWRGNAQFVVIHQFPGSGDAAIEADNLGADETAEPRTDPTLFNFTLVGTSENVAMVLREGVRGTLRNFVLSGFGEPPDLRAAEVDLSAEWPTYLSIEQSVFFGVGAWPVEADAEDDDLGFDEEAAITDAARANDMGSVDPQLGSVAASDPDYVPANTAMGERATPAFNDRAPSGFGDVTATYAGAFAPGGTDWTAGWTAYPAN
jgi:hypothetical protein